MMRPICSSAIAGDQRGRGATWALVELFWIFLIFFLAGAAPPPGVGESHYLAKAKHYWNPTWCAGDLFLESADAHLVFYWLFGWVTRFLPLPACAWLGRAITWAGLAWSWRRLSVAVCPGPLWSLLSAGLMLLGLRYFSLAGEWIVGGVEAKCFSYPLIFLGVEALVKNRWRAALLFCGAATALHVLAGGWSLVALALAWLFSGTHRPAPRTLWPAAVGAVLLALPGLLPALWLNHGAAAETVREGNVVYVFARLSHHLVFHQFPWPLMLRHAILLAVWVGLARSTGALVEQESGPRRLNLFVLGAVLIALFGIGCDYLLLARYFIFDEKAGEYQAQAAGWLRYYFFRTSDAWLPIGVALGVTRLCAARGPKANFLLIGCVLLAGANLAESCIARAQRRLPEAFLQPNPTADSLQSQFADWRAVCDWIRHETPPDAKFLTPYRQQTFKWYAQRAEVVSLKDIPQDAAGLVQWHQTILAVFPPQHGGEDWSQQDTAHLCELARRYGAKYLVVDRRRTSRPIPLPRVYPLLREENQAYEVLLVPPHEKN